MRLDAATAKTLAHGRRIRATLKQAERAPQPVEQQIATLLALGAELFDLVALLHMDAAQTAIGTTVSTLPTHLIDRLSGTGKLAGTDRSAIMAMVHTALEPFMPPPANIRSASPRRHCAGTMSATIAGLHRKIATAGDLQSVVRAMKALAAASIAQYERSVAALADYQRTVSLGLGVCIRGQAVVPTLPDRRQRTIKIVVFGSDQGLVRRYNDIVADLATSLAAGQASGPVAIWTVGQRVRELMVDSGKAIENSFDVPSSVDAINSFVGQLLVADEALLAADRLIGLHLVYNEITASAAHRPVSVQLLPLDDAWRESETAEAWPTSGLPEVLATDAETLAAFVRKYLFVLLFRACAKSLAGENSSRLSAMQRAEKNIDGLRDTLGGEFHRLRQASIDEELFDVVAGYEALRSDTNRPN